MYLITWQEGLEKGLSLIESLDESGKVIIDLTDTGVELSTIKFYEIGNEINLNWIRGDSFSPSKEVKYKHNGYVLWCVSIYKQYVCKMPL